MEKKHNDLWQGGPWEQPSRPVQPLPVIPQTHRPVLRVKKRRRSLLPILIPIAVILSLVLAGMLIWYFDLLPDIRFGRFYGDDFPFPYLDEDFDHREQSYDYSTPPSIPAAATGTGVTLTLEQGEDTPLSYEEIYNLCAPSIVSLTTTSRHGANTGTGIILTEDGYILTNAHVVAGGTHVEVVTFDNRIATAKLVGFDAETIKKAAEDNGFLIRIFMGMGEKHLRITIGTEEEMKKLTALLVETLEKARQ